MRSQKKSASGECSKMRKEQFIRSLSRKADSSTTRRSHIRGRAASTKKEAIYLLKRQKLLATQCLQSANPCRDIVALEEYDITFLRQDMKDEEEDYDPR